VEVQRLQLTSFRSYDALDLGFGAGPQVIVGANAAGKTNLLEALALLGSGRSHRTATEIELIAWSAEFARVAASVQQAGAVGPMEVEVVLARSSPSAARKRIRVNGVPRRASALTGSLRVVLFAPEDMLLVVGSPALRRGALDALAAQRFPLYARTLSTYGRALQQRNGLLRAIREGLAGSDQLAYWDELLINEGGTLVAQRLDLLEELAAPLAAAHAEIAPEEEALVAAYVTNAPALPGEGPPDALRRRLAETAEKELWNGSTLVGPHRDDIGFSIGERELSTFASRGQQRTAILAFKLAALDLLTALDGHPPLLLLDDVFSELDPRRRAHLVRRVGELPQAFITTTALSDLDAELIRLASVLEVRPGSVRPLAAPVPDR
jgi:DNA replication and repair protein RecF